MKFFTPVVCFIILVMLMSGCGKTQRNVAKDPDAIESDSSGLRVLCYNIHHCNPPSKQGLIDLDAISKVINYSKPDIVALQEVDVHTGRSGSGLHQAEGLACKTGMQSYFAKAIDYDGGEYGVAILSRFPMESTMKFDLPTAAGTNGEPRILATAVITLPGKEKIRFACTHLDAQKNDTNRVLQMARINNEPYASDHLPVFAILKKK